MRIAEKRGVKMHVDATPDSHVLLGGEMSTLSYCGNPVWARIAMPVPILEQWAESGLSMQPLCSACVSRSGVKVGSKELVGAA